MSLRESFELSLKTLGRNRLRSALTLLGIAIGVGAVLAMVAVGDGARSAIEEQVTAAGLNVITVTAGNYKMKVSDPGDVGADHASLWEDIDRVDLDAPTLQGRRRRAVRRFRPRRGRRRRSSRDAPRRRSDGKARPSNRAAAARRLRGRPGRRRDADGDGRGRDPRRGRRRAARGRRRARVGASRARRAPLVHAASRDRAVHQPDPPIVGGQPRPVLHRP